MVAKAACEKQRIPGQISAWGRPAVSALCSLLLHSVRIGGDTVLGTAAPIGIFCLVFESQVSALPSKRIGLEIITVRCPMTSGRPDVTRVESFRTQQSRTCHFETSYSLISSIKTNKQMKTFS